MGRAAGAGQIVLAPWDMGLAGAGGYFWLRELFLALVADPRVVFPPRAVLAPRIPPRLPCPFQDAQPTEHPQEDVVRVSGVVLENTESAGWK